MLKGGFEIIKGPLKDNTGKEVMPAGKAYAEKATELESTNYLVEGVKGSTDRRGRDPGWHGFLRRPLGRPSRRNLSLGCGRRPSKLAGDKPRAWTTLP